MLANCLFSRNPERPFDTERPRNWGSFGAANNPESRQYAPHGHRPRHRKETTIPEEQPLKGRLKPLFEKPSQCQPVEEKPDLRIWGRWQGRQPLNFSSSGKNYSPAITIFSISFVSLQFYTTFPQPSLRTHGPDLAPRPRHVH